MMNRNRQAAFFDLDFTITDRDSFRYFLKEYYFQNITRLCFIPYVSIWGMLRKLRLVSLQTFKERSLIALRGKQFNYVQRVGQSFLKNALAICLREQAILRIEWHQSRGDFVFIVTSSPDIYLNALCEHLDCDGYEGSKLAYHDGKFTGLFEGRDCLGSEKLARINAIAEGRHLNLENSFAYSDHESDLPMLEKVGNPVAVSPTFTLKEIAKERGWPIENW